LSGGDLNSPNIETNYCPLPNLHFSMMSSTREKA
jgi:hypothetical protein